MSTVVFFVLAKMCVGSGNDQVCYRLALSSSSSFCRSRLRPAACNCFLPARTMLVMEGALARGPRGWDEVEETDDCRVSLVLAIKAMRWAGSRLQLGYRLASTLPCRTRLPLLPVVLVSPGNKHMDGWINAKSSLPLCPKFARGTSTGFGFWRRVAPSGSPQIV